MLSAHLYPFMTSLLDWQVWKVLDAMKAFSDKVSADDLELRMKECLAIARAEAI